MVVLKASLVFPLRPSLLVSVLHPLLSPVCSILIWHTDTQKVFLSAVLEFWLDVCYSQWQIESILWSQFNNGLLYYHSKY